MYRRARLSLLSGVVLLALSLVPGSALASERHGDSLGPPVQGTVTQVSLPNSLQILAQGASVTFALTGSTRVIRICVGSLTDVHAGQRVFLHLIRGTTTVDGIRIDVQRPPAGDRGSRTEALFAMHSEIVQGNSGTVARAPVAPSQPSGQVVSVQKGSITVRVWHGKAITYTLSSSLTVTKLLGGTTADLATGETVSVQRARDGSAAVVEILNA